jgi:hypothetical protein
MPTTTITTTFTDPTVGGACIDASRAPAAEKLGVDPAALTYVGSVTTGVLGADGAHSGFEITITWGVADAPAT